MQLNKKEQFFKRLLKLILLHEVYKIFHLLTKHSLKNFKQSTRGNKPPNFLDGNWGDWSAWTTCSVICGGGNQTRTRQCDKPPPANGGANCPPQTDEKESLQTCGTQLCPVGKHIFKIKSICSHSLMKI